ncbi:AAA family ATPase [Actinoplanes sp. CA-252034]|uniref:polysaccharide biosynthesis tyrosine autokinase n=1 Tax=Actinoplanes sp. CA-252034 TaxID=3239906 RepID=UPI003D97B550
MTTYGRGARLLRRYGLWTLAVTAAAVTATWGLHRTLPAGYESRATVLVEPRFATGAPDPDTERQIILSDVVSVPAAARVGVDTTRLLDGLAVETAPGSGVLRFVYTAGDGVTARARVRALVESYAAYRPGVSVLSEPDLPTEPAARPLVPDLAAALAAGLLLGAGTAYLRSRTRRTVRDRDDFAMLTGAPVLATVPRHRRAGAPIVLREPDSPAAEAYRYLRSRLQPSLRPTGTTTILVTSPGPRQGRTTTAANLAVTLARTGRAVVLVDADLRNPQLHHVFQTNGDHGLTTLLDGDATVSEVLEETPVPHLRLIPAGAQDRLIPAGSQDREHADLLDSGQLARVLRAVQKHADVIVLDSPAVLSAADPIALAALSDQVLLVGDFARTRRETVRRALAELAEVVHGNVRPVLVNVPKSAGALVPRRRRRPPTTAALTRDRLVSDADDVAPPAVTSHSYVEIDAVRADPLADYHARTATVAVPVIYGTPLPKAEEDTATEEETDTEAATPVGSPTPSAAVSD